MSNPWVVPDVAIHPPKIILFTWQIFLLPDSYGRWKNLPLSLQGLHVLSSKYFTWQSDLHWENLSWKSWEAYQSNLLSEKQKFTVRKLNRCQVQETGRKWPQDTPISYCSKSLTTSKASSGSRERAQAIYRNKESNDGSFPQKQCKVLKEKFNGLTEENICQIEFSIWQQYNLKVKTNYFQMHNTKIINHRMIYFIKKANRSMPHLKFK